MDLEQTAVERLKVASEWRIYERKGNRAGAAVLREGDWTRRRVRKLQGRRNPRSAGIHHFDECGDYVGDDNEMLLEDILANAGVKVHDA